MKLALTAAMTLAVFPALAETFDYFDASTGATAATDCLVNWNDSGATFRMAHATFEWVEENRQGRWATGLLNDRPAVRYEIDRTRYSYSTLDLMLFLDTSE